MENQEKLDTDTQADTQTPEIRLHQPIKSVGQEILRFGLYFLAGVIISELIVYLLQKTSGIDIQGLATSTQTNNFNITQRNVLRLVIFLNQLLLIGLPAYFTLRWLFKSDWFINLGLNIRVKQVRLFLAVLMLLASAPMIYFLEEINKQLPLPAWMKAMEQTNDGLLNAMFSKEYWYEMYITFILVAAVPAFCEELLFRGWLQPLVRRIFKNDHVAVWTTAVIFSAIHFQFEGFAARVVLGAILGYLFVWTKSLWYSMFVHFFNNGAQLLTLYSLNIKPEDVDKLNPEEHIHWTIAGLSLVSVLFLGNVIRDLSNGVQFFKMDDSKNL